MAKSTNKISPKSKIFENELIQELGNLTDEELADRYLVDAEEDYVYPDPENSENFQHQFVKSFYLEDGKTANPAFENFIVDVFTNDGCRNKLRDSLFEALNKAKPYGKRLNVPQIIADINTVLVTDYMDLMENIYSSKPKTIPPLYENLVNYIVGNLVEDGAIASLEDSYSV